MKYREEYDEAPSFEKRRKPLRSREWAIDGDRVERKKAKKPWKKKRDKK